MHKDQKGDGYLFRSELQLNKSSIDELLRQVREQEREREKARAKSERRRAKVGAEVV